MAFHFSPKIVRDGLVLYLDAANIKSYVSGSTAWNDLTPNRNNGTLTNGPTFDSANVGSIVFDGIDDRVSKVGSINTGDNFSVNAWIYPTLLGTTRRAIVGNAYDFSDLSRSGWLLSTAPFGQNNSLYLSIGKDDVVISSPANSLNINTWQCVTATVVDGGGVVALYINGKIVPIGGFSNSETIDYTDTEFNIGYRHTTNQTDPYSGNISSVSIYNRALSAQEVLQNYNATKGRYGL